MSVVRRTRDSQTEGLNDGDDRHGFRGWADRLAASDSQFCYANLAVRGRRAIRFAPSS